MSELNAEATILKLKSLILNCDLNMEAFGPDAGIQIVVPGKWGNSNFKRLWGKAGGPKGRIVTNTVGDGKLLVLFKAIDVRAAAEAKIRELRQ